VKVARKSYIKVGTITVGSGLLYNQRRKVKGNLKIMTFIGDVWHRTQVGIAEVVSTGGPITGYSYCKSSCTIKIKVDRQYWDRIKHSTLEVSSMPGPRANPYVFGRFNPGAPSSLANLLLESKLKEFLK